MYTSEATANISKALAAAQGAFPAIPRDKTVRVSTRNGSAYTFSYAPLETIMSAIRSALSAHGLAISQGAEVLDSGIEVLFTRLSHESGEWMENRTMIHVEKNEGKTAQAYASGLTYARRYGVTMLLCLATEDDDDGNAASGNSVEHSIQRPPRKPAVISVDRAQAIRDTLRERQIDEAKFVGWLGAGSLESLTDAQATRGEAELARRAAKGEAA